MGQVKVKPEEIRWDQVEMGAREILKACDSAKYTPPEGQQINVNRATAAMNHIAESLCLSTLKD